MRALIWLQKKNRIPDEKQLISVTEKLAQELEEQSKQLDELRETVRLYLLFLTTVTVTFCFCWVWFIFILHFVALVLDWSAC